MFPPSSYPAEVDLVVVVVAVLAAGGGDPVGHPVSAVVHAQLTARPAGGWGMLSRQPPGV